MLRLLMVVEILILVRMAVTNRLFEFRTIYVIIDPQSDGNWINSRAYYQLDMFF